MKVLLVNKFHYRKVVERHIISILPRGCAPSDTR